MVFVKKIFTGLLLLTLFCTGGIVPVTVSAAGITQSPTFNGTNQYLSRTNAAQTGLGLTGNFTLECWVNFNVLPSVSGSSNDLIAKGDNNGGYRLFVTTGNLLRVGYRSAATDLTAIQSSAAISGLATGTWFHLAAAVNVSAKTAVLTVNGSAVANTVAVANSTTVANDILASFTLGALDNDGSPTDYSNTRLSVCRVWTTNQSAATINANKCTVFGSAQTNLVGEWSLDNVLTDGSGNGNTLTNNGTVTFGAGVPSCLQGATALTSIIGLVRAWWAF